MVVEALGNRRVDRVHPQRKIGRQHHGGVLLRRIMSIRHGVLGRGILGLPLLRAGRARRQPPLIFMEVVEEAVVPLRRGVGPCALEPARDRAGALAGTGGVLPSDEPRLYRRVLTFLTDLLRTVRIMGLSDGTPAA